MLASGYTLLSSFWFQNTAEPTGHTFLPLLPRQSLCIFKLEMYHTLHADTMQKKEELQSQIWVPLVTLRAWEAENEKWENSLWEDKFMHL